MSLPLSPPPPPDQISAQSPLDYAFAVRDVDVLTMVRTALENGWCRLAVQPVVLAGDVQKIAFYEGLIRVQDDRGRIIPAGQFLPVIGETDLGREVDCASLRLGFDLLRTNPTLRLSINTSARSIADGKWRRVMDQGLAADPLAGERLILEIGESQAMLLPEVVIRFMEEMQPCGVSFALDDFGAGMTAFRHLKDFFFDLVKIDRLFIAGIHESPDNQVITEALTMISHQFEMFAVAQGVERVEEARFLQGIGIDCLQGYYLGRPGFQLA
ncbi:MAG: diguanylate phosphodiesterase [Rhodobacterales bacterium]|nr:MAG: diguanylate phosphodiesterase [Rhodobacterales bacterium]